MRPRRFLQKRPDIKCQQEAKFKEMSKRSIVRNGSSLALCGEVAALEVALTRHHGCPQTPGETQDRGKEGHDQADRQVRERQNRWTPEARIAECCRFAGGIWCPARAGGRAARRQSPQHHSTRRAASPAVPTAPSVSSEDRRAAGRRAAPRRSGSPTPRPGCAARARSRATARTSCLC